MKQIWLSCLCLLLAIPGLATNYYLANNGNDGNTGLSPIDPWQTITKLNTLSYHPGDTVFFRSGDLFRGAVNVAQTGSPQGNIVFTSYGSGPAPIISGAELLSGWTPSGNHYQASSVLQVRNFFVNGRSEDLARYPNPGQYLWLDSARTNYLRDADLLNLPDSLVQGSKLCIHTAQWCWELSGYQRINDDTLFYNVPTELKALDGYGYFLYDNIHHIDTAREWKYESGPKLLHYQPENGVDPNTLTCEASVYNHGIQLSQDVCYVVIEGLDFEKQGVLGVYIPNGGARYNVIRNCRFRQQAQYGVWDRGKFNQITDNSFHEVAGIGAYISHTGANTEIARNSFQNIGPRRHMGVGKQINHSAITLAYVDSCHVHHNEIDSTGYCGISADGTEHLVERNIIRNAMRLNNDGAAIKSYGAQSFNNVFRNNFIQGSDGNREGCNNADFLTPGIYFDFNVHNSKILDNTIYDHLERGIFINAGNHDNEIRGNVVLGGLRMLELNGSAAQPDSIYGMDIKRNSFFAQSPNDFILRQVDFSGFFQAGDIDSNYYFQPYDANHYVERMIGTVPNTMNFGSWQATGNDAATRPSFVNWTLPQNDVLLLMNMTDNMVYENVMFNSFYPWCLDLDSTSICYSYLLEPYSSVILIRTGVWCEIAVEDEIDQNGLRYVPNPSNGRGELRVDPKWIGKPFRIIGLNGQVLHSGKISQTQQSLDLGELPAGMYMLQAGKEWEGRLKLIIQ